MNQKLADFVAIFLGLRKTILMFALFLMAVIFRVKGLVNGDQLVTLLQSTTIGFFAANSIERVGEVVKHYTNSKGQEEDEKEVVVGDGESSGN